MPQARAQRRMAEALLADPAVLGSGETALPAALVPYLGGKSRITADGQLV